MAEPFFILNPASSSLYLILEMLGILITPGYCVVAISVRIHLIDKQAQILVLFFSTTAKATMPKAKNAKGSQTPDFCGVPAEFVHLQFVRFPAAALLNRPRLKSG